MRIILVEDMADLAAAPSAHLASLGHVVKWCSIYWSTEMMPEARHRNAIVIADNAIASELEGYAQEARSMTATMACRLTN